MPTKNRRKLAPGTVIAPHRKPKPDSYTLTDKECELAAVFAKRHENSVPALRFVVACDGNSTKIGVDHQEEAVGDLLLMSALGTANGYFSGALLNQLANVASRGMAVDATALNRVVAIVQGIAPRDETEALLAAQMAAIHNATMTAARRLNHVDNIPQQDSASNMLNKLARTFAGQVEALKKYRSTGEQIIRVQHVNVSDGGQAIVGNFQTGGGGKHENDEQSHEPGHSLTQRPALPCNVQANKTTMPSASRKGKDCVPLSRCSRRGAKGPS